MVSRYQNTKRKNCKIQWKQSEMDFDLFKRENVAKSNDINRTL